jgi:long-chain fatty acid transport protein
MADDYQFLNFGAKADVNDTISVGAFFDQPWGADVEFSGDNNFVGTPTAVIADNTNQVYSGAAQLLTAINRANNPNAPAVSVTTADSYKNAVGTVQNTIAYLNSVGQTDKATELQDNLTKLQKAAGTANFVNNNLSKVTGATNVSVSSQNFTGLLGVKLGEKKNIQIYGGPTIQRLEGDVHLRGNAYKTASGYDANITRDTAYGWMAGIAYLKPEIALKAALTYRSEIDHDVTTTENFPALGAAGVGTSEITITMPKSVNLDFQTGINPTTLLTAKARWVPWSDFAIKPTIYGKASGLNLISYDDDAWTAEVGLGKKLSPQLAISGAVGYDSGAGNPITSLGPVEGNWNVGLGAKYNLTPEWAISGGVKYLMFGDAKAKLPDGSIVGDFQDNDGWVYGVRLSYQKK